MLYREHLVPDDAIAANPLLVCLCVFHDPIIYGYELMYTAKADTTTQFQWQSP
jgi:hypothetical protein